MDALARSAQRIDRSIATLRAEVAAPPKPPPPAALAKLDARVGALRDPVNALRDATNDTSTVDQLHNLQRSSPLQVFSLPTEVVLSQLLESTLSGWRLYNKVGRVA